MKHASRAAQMAIPTSVFDKQNDVRGQGKDAWISCIRGMTKARISNFRYDGLRTRMNYCVEMPDSDECKERWIFGLPAMLRYKKTLDS